ncbi:hypothetical protein HK101_001751 [Irineochytrium annulatum]|nr:hypothetical protein HK101_001751 [Irineochytrium annulatum]
MISSPSPSAVAVLLVALASSVLAQWDQITNPVPAAKAGTPIIVGGWLFTDHYPADPNQVFDTNADFNSRIGYMASAFQVSESVPLTSADNAVDITVWNDNSTAGVFVTVYAENHGLKEATDDALANMAQRLGNISAVRSPVWLRYCPEMNGGWMTYGKQPEAYVANWKRMYAQMRLYAPNVLLVWSPNYDLPVADTSYWPGPEYVDWVGTSSYWKGFGKDEAAPSDYVPSAVDNVYNTYAVAYNKSFIISEASGAYETGPKVSVGVTQAQLQYSFWGSVLNTDYLDSHPLFKGIFLFEFAKMEEYFRDFRCTRDQDTTAAFRSLLKNLDSAGRIAWAQGAVPTTTMATTTTTTAVATATSTATVMTTSAVAVTTVGPSATSTKSGSGGLEMGGLAGLAMFALAAIIL